jgi:hypothetical protein
MINISATSISLGILCAAVLVTRIAYKKKRLGYEYVGYAGGFFLSGCNIPPSLYICYFSIFLSSDLPKTLEGYDKYLGFAGLCTLSVSIISIVSLFQKAVDPPPDENILPTEPTRRGGSAKVTRPRKPHNKH